MADITPTDAPKRRRTGMPRPKKHSLRTDMTPMVDLGFLLIAFFVMTTELQKPMAFRLAFPDDKTISPPQKLISSNALTVLLDGNNKLYYYHGRLEEAIHDDLILPTSFSEATGLGKIIRETQAQLQTAHLTKEGRDGLMLLIKASKNASYSMVVDALDEALINGVKRYAVVKIEAEETAFLLRKH